MKNPRLAKWSDLDKTEGLLLFAQRLVECLSDYTLDSYKTPALNTHTRCIELLRTISDVRAGIASNKSLEPLVEELAHSVHCDTAARALLGAHSENLSGPSWWEIGNLDRLKVQVDFLYGFLWQRQYEHELKAQLQRLIRDPKEKARILDVTINLAIEWMYLGFSRDYIFVRAKWFFFGIGGDKIKSPDTLEEFFKAFEPSKKKFDVCFRVAASWASVGPDKLRDFVDLSLAPPPPRDHLRFEMDFLGKTHDGAFAIVRDIEALDARSARNKAFDRLTVLADIAAFHTHRNPFQWEAEALVWENTFPTVLKPSVPPIHKEDECPSNQLSDRIQDMIKALGPHKLEPDSWLRIAAAVGLHSSALRSQDVAVQLSTLWAAFEALLPATVDESKIGTITEAVVPVLSRFYPVKLLVDLADSLESCCGLAYGSARSGLYTTDHEIIQLASILTIDANEPLRDILYRALNHNPLLRNRIFILKQSLESSNNIKSLIAGHSQRVSWHLSRIYRNRNLFIHSGRSLPYRDSLVENLHSYFHQLLSTIERLFSQPTPPADLDSALLRVRMDHFAHLDILKSEKNTHTTPDNLRLLVFGPTMPPFAKPE